MSPSGVARRGVNGSVALSFDLPPVLLRLHQRRNLAVCDFIDGATCPFANSTAAQPGCLQVQWRRNLSVETGAGDVKVDYQCLVCATPSRGTAAEQCLSDPSARTEVRNRSCARACAQMSPARPTCANRRTETKPPSNSAVLRLCSPPRRCVWRRFESRTRGSPASVCQAPQMIRIPRERHAPPSLG